MQTRAIILAAGKGTRMKSEKFKVLHEVCGTPMIQHVISNLNKSGITDIYAVLGHGSETVGTYLGEGIRQTVQEEQLGTAHAVMQWKEELADLDGHTMVVCGDTPLITETTMQEFMKYHLDTGAKATILSSRTRAPFGYGRIVRKENGSVKRIVEEKDATDLEREIKEVSSGTFIFDNRALFGALENVGNDNAQDEYYLPDVVSILRGRGARVEAYISPDFEETLGINDRVALANAEEILRKRINTMHMQNGVTLIHPETTYIDAEVEIGTDSIIYPGAIIRGDTRIGKNVIISSGTEIKDSIIDDEAEIKHSVVTEAKVGRGTKVGPFAQLRPQSELGEEVKIGNFVEVKKSRLENESKVSHLSYIGDASIGARTNVGCGTITVNYDGKNKFKTEIGMDSFIGCNSNLVAPVKIGDRSFIAAGSTITDEVPEDSLAIARNRQTTKTGYYNKDN